VIDRSAFLPWIDHVDSGFPEVFGVARGQRRAACPADGGYLRVEAVYGETETIASGQDRGVPDRGIGIEGLNEFAEGPVATFTHLLRPDRLVDLFLVMLPGLPEHSRQHDRPFGSTPVRDPGRNIAQPDP
jgi:hypothetical protein